MLIIVVAYHSDEHLPPCIQPLTGSHDLLIVDNDPNPKTEDIVRANGARYLAAPTNLGFARAVNLGLREAWDGKSDVLLLNPDAQVDPAALASLARELHAVPRRAAVGPLLANPDGSPQHPDWPLPSPGQVWYDAFGQSRRWRGRRFVVGAVLLLNGEALNELGGLDERYFLYAEEADWQLRAQRAGWSVAVAHEVTATHVGGASSKDSVLRESLFNRSGAAFARKWYGRSGAAVMHMGSFVAATRRSVFGSDEARDASRRALTGHIRRPRPTPEPGRGHVVHVVRSDGFAGVERYIADVASELPARGWRVTVIGGDPARMRDELPLGVQHLPAVTTVDVLRQLRRCGDADVIHAHMTAAEVPAALLKGRARLIVTRHFAARRGRSLVGRLARSFVARRVDLQIAISRFVAVHVDGPSTVIHSGVRSAAEAPVDRARIVLMLQRLEPEKDTATAIHAWAKTGLAEQGWQLLIQGQGSEQDALETLAYDLGVGGSVVFAGYTEHPQVVLAQVSILLATTPAEGFGLAVVEAMAAGTPVIAASSGAHHETLGELGVYFAAGDSASCAKALLALSGDEARRASLGALLQKRQQSLFSVGVHLDALERAYSRYRTAQMPSAEMEGAAS